MPSQPKSTSRRRLSRTVAATAAVAVAALCAGGAAPAPVPHSARAAAAPGALLTAPTATDFRIIPGVPTPTRAWHVTYRSTSATGRANTVTGTVIVPADGRSPKNRPLLTYAVGTVGLGDQCAPSATFPQGKTEEAPLIETALLHGWAVAVTDYEGLGTPAAHTYTVGRAEGTAMLDAARAAEHTPGAQSAGVGAHSPVGIMGYSQGGQASAWAAQLAASYAPELQVKGSASGGVPADLQKVAAYNDGDPDAGLILMSAIGHDNAYPELKLDSYLTPEGKKLADGMRKGCLDENTKAGANRTIDSVTTRNPLNQPDWKARIDADKLGRTAPAHPAFLYHGGSDEIIPHAVGVQLARDWCAKGVPVDFHTVPLAQHVGAAIAGTVPAMNFLADRFAGKPAPTDCP